MPIYVDLCSHFFFSSLKECFSSSSPCFLLLLMLAQRARASPLQPLLSARLPKALPYASVSLDPPSLSQPPRSPLFWQELELSVFATASLCQSEQCQMLPVSFAALFRWPLVVDRSTAALDPWDLLLFLMSPSIPAELLLFGFLALREVGLTPTATLERPRT